MTTNLPLYRADVSRDKYYEELAEFKLFIIHAEFITEAWREDDGLVTKWRILANSFYIRTRKIAA